LEGNKVSALRVEKVDQETIGIFLQRGRAR
jgi:hypothetical protein